MPAGSSAALSRFVFVAAMPAFIFISLARIPTEKFFDWPFITVLGGGMALTFGLSVAIARRFFPDTLTAQGLHGLTAMFSSTAYIGLPIILIVYGDDALAPAIIGAVITGAVFLPVTVVMAELDGGRATGSIVVGTTQQVLRNPLLLGTAAGLAVSAADLSLPDSVARFCDVLGGAFIPCALFAAGLFVAERPIQGGRKEIAWLVGVKLFLHPFITAGLAYGLFDLPGQQAAIAVLQAALPAGVPVFVLAQHYHTFVRRASAVIVISTMLSVVTISALLVVLAKH